MKEIILNYYLEFLLGLSITLTSYLITKIKRWIGDNKLIKEGICALQRNSLLKTCEDYLSRGWCTMQQKVTLNELYNSYTKLSGDGFIKELVEQVNRLPLVERNEIIQNRPNQNQDN